MKIAEFRFTIEDYHSDKEVHKMVQSILELNRNEEFMKDFQETDTPLTFRPERFVLRIVNRECE